MWADVIVLSELLVDDDLSLPSKAQNAARNASCLPLSHGEN